MGETITIETDHSPKDVECVFVKGGLAVHEYPLGCFNNWTITHVASGWAISKGIASRDIAIEAAHDLLTIADWTKAKDELLADVETIREAARPIFKHHGIYFASDYGRRA